MESEGNYTNKTDGINNLINHIKRHITLNPLEEQMILSKVKTLSPGTKRYFRNQWHRI